MADYPVLDQVATVHMRQAWEYKTVLAKSAGVFSGKLKTTDIDAELSAAGAEGWELVAAFQGSNVSANLPGVLLMFKRPAYTGV